MYLYIYIFVCIYIHTNLYTYIHIHIHIQIYINISILQYICLQPYRFFCDTALRINTTHKSTYMHKNI